MTLEERSIIEDAYRSGVLRAITATTTLAAGVNLPASRVVIRSCKTYKSDPITTSDFQQMAGRAGRAGETAEGGVGEAILVVEDHADRRIADEVRPASAFARARARAPLSRARCGDSSDVLSS